ncbi:hypothetical protein [Demequina mangrovi]|uniref:Uncharacterized protein n=1 Tax=Demequina mangrovi TaxID=1043493 RepID=A0A1H6X9P9_9MICO|nr:hypothetical protein [Demequina mangrovi]SEJ25931.1 hypothetical protein SAMN05421637_1358 [Demequina mangrovi]
MKGARVESEVLDWLLAGDVAVRYQTHRTLLGSPEQVLVPVHALHVLAHFDGEIAPDGGEERPSGAS